MSSVVLPSLQDTHGTPASPSVPDIGRTFHGFTEDQREHIQVRKRNVEDSLKQRVQYLYKIFKLEMYIYLLCKLTISVNVHRLSKSKT